MNPPKTIHYEIVLHIPGEARLPPTSPTTLGPSWNTAWTMRGGIPRCGSRRRSTCPKTTSGRTAIPSSMCSFPAWRSSCGKTFKTITARSRRTDRPISDSRCLSSSHTAGAIAFSPRDRPGAGRSLFSFHEMEQAMTQRDLNRSVATSTGETVGEISRRGFVPLDDLNRDSDPPIDWDELEARRFVKLTPQRKRPAIAG